MSRSIVDLQKLVENLDDDDRSLFHRIYRYYIEVGKLRLPEFMRTKEKFGNCEAQQIVRVTNKITYESTLFNRLRSKRPIMTKTSKDVSKVIDESRGDIFCNPENTPEDIFGRIEGKFCITASNISKYDYMHAVIIFRDHTPFVYEEEKIYDILDVAFRWFEKANEYDRRATYPFFVWNCLWRAGASIIHGHAHALISKEPYSKYEFYDSVRKTYAENYHSEYFDDLYRIHKALGLGFTLGNSKILVYLTPIKEKEVVIIAENTTELAKSMSYILKRYYEMGVRSFNAAVFIPPLGTTNILIARIVDRGDLSIKTSDIGGMELYAGTSVVSTDPFVLAEMLKI